MTVTVSPRVVMIEHEDHLIEAVRCQPGEGPTDLWTIDYPWLGKRQFRGTSHDVRAEIRRVLEAGDRRTGGQS